MNRKLYLIFVILSWLVLSCGGGGGGSSNPNTAPPVPENIVSVSGNAQDRLSWGNASGATSYNVYWSNSSGVSKKTGTKISAVTSPYYHGGLNNDTTYYYVITATNQYGESSESVEVSATPSLTNPPLPPTHVATLTLNEQAIVRWTVVETEDANTSHNIYWSTSSGVTKGNGTKIVNAVSPYTHENLTNGTIYYYVVTTVNQRGESIESEETSATPDLGNMPTAPTGVTAIEGDRQATIRWNAVNNATTYNIYWSTSADVSSTSGTKIEAVTSPHTHTALTQGTVYNYVMTAVNGYGESLDSATVSVTIPDYRQDVCVALGDSITVGTFIDNYADTYVARLSAAWGKTIYNKGVAGTLSSYGANVIDSILAQYNPRYITIFYGNNDNGFFDIDWIIGNLRYMIRSAKANGTTPVIATLTPVFGQWAWRKPSAIILSERIRQLASEEGISCADLEAAFGWNPDYIILSDGMHPNSAGHQIIANTFYSALTP
jgi:lysophospholipase L1-like esterase/fibronectin type 3 domain-containing protein